jgi:hypothetical protein
MYAINNQYITRRLMNGQFLINGVDICQRTCLDRDIGRVPVAFSGIGLFTRLEVIDPQFDKVLVPESHFLPLLPNTHPIFDASIHQAAVHVFAYRRACNSCLTLGFPASSRHKLPWTKPFGKLAMTCIVLL